MSLVVSEKYIQRLVTMSRGKTIVPFAPCSCFVSVMIRTDDGRPLTEDTRPRKVDRRRRTARIVFVLGIRIPPTESPGTADFNLLNVKINCDNNNRLGLN